MTVQDKEMVGRRKWNRMLEEVKSRGLRKKLWEFDEKKRLIRFRDSRERGGRDTLLLLDINEAVFDAISVLSTGLFSGSWLGPLGGHLPWLAIMHKNTERYKILCVGAQEEKVIQILYKIYMWLKVIVQQ